MAKATTATELAMREGPTRGDVIAGHLSWLRQYTECMTAENWKDMQLYLRRQLGELEEVLSLERSVALLPSSPQTPYKG
jgi:hypothetical protein